MKRLLKILAIGIVSILGIGLIGAFILIEKQVIHSFDYPTQLLDKEETIELMYMTWACDCAEWARPEDVRRYSGNTNDTLARLSIFIEAANATLKIPEEYKLSCCGNRIRFRGRFYKDGGIARDYEQKTSEKPEPARVFRYSSYLIVKPYTVWDFTAPDTSELKTKTSK